MGNPVKLHGDPAEPQFRNTFEPKAPADARLQVALAAYQSLKLDVRAQSRPLADREAVTRFLRQFGQHLYRVLVDGADGRRPLSGQPVCLRLAGPWAAYPWELLHDGEHWLALQRGVVRLVESVGASAPAEAPAAGAQPFRALAAHALPLPERDDSALRTQYRDAESRFVTDPLTLLGTGPASPGRSLVRVLPHATLDEWREIMAHPPHLLIWAGFASASHWFFESVRGEPVACPVGELAGLLRQAVGGGLRTLVVNDALGLLDPEAALVQSRNWLGTGLPTLIRIEGVQSRARSRDYIRNLMRHMAAGDLSLDGHLAAVRRLSRRFEAGWDWSYLRFHAARPPAEEVGPGPGAAAPRAGSGSADESAGRRRREWLPLLRHAPPPASLRPRHRLFGRHAEQRTLLRALLPELAGGAPFVFLSGPPGSGKTALALALGHRLRRRFDEVHYLDATAVLPSPGALWATEDLPWQPPPPDEWLLATLARSLGCRPAAVSVPDRHADSGATVRATLNDGRNRLLLLDGLDRFAGFEPFLAALQQVPAGSRVLVTSRGKTPLLPGPRVELAPIGSGDLARITDWGFLERLESDPQGEALRAACRQDLLLARLLARLPRWPPAETLGAAAPPPDGEAGAGTSRLLALCATAALECLSRAARDVLTVLVFCGGRVQEETLAILLGETGGIRSGAVSDLQWFGLAEALDDESWFTVPPRLQQALAAPLIGREVYARLAPRWALAQQSLLAEAGEALAHVHEPEPWRQGPQALAWGRPLPLAEGAQPLLRRLGLERGNLAELSTMLAEEGDVRDLTRLVEAGRSLTTLSWLADVHLLMAVNLYGAAREARDEIAQARALNRLGAALLTIGQARAAAPALERALVLLSQADGWETLWETYLLLSRAYERQDKMDAAGNLLNSAVELAYQLGDGNKLVTALRALSRVWGRQGVQHEIAGQVLPRAMIFLERREQFLQAALVRALLAECEAQGGDLSAAEANYRLALKAFLAAGDQPAAAVVALSLADVVCRSGQPDAAWQLARDAASVLTEAGGAQLGETTPLIYDIARWCETHDRPDLALEAYAHLRALYERQGDFERLLRVLDRLGGVYFQLGRQTDSTRCYEERLRLQARANGP